MSAINVILAGLVSANFETLNGLLSPLNKHKPLSSRRFQEQSQKYGNEFKKLA